MVCSTKGHDQDPACPLSVCPSQPPSHPYSVPSLDVLLSSFQLFPALWATTPSSVTHVLLFLPDFSPSNQSCLLQESSELSHNFPKCYIQLPPLQQPDFAKEMTTQHRLPGVALSVQSIKLWSHRELFIIVAPRSFETLIEALKSRKS